MAHFITLKKALVLVIFLFFFIPRPVFAGSHFAHFYFIPNPGMSRKVAVGDNIYILLYSGVKVLNQHPYYGGKLDIVYPGQNVEFLNAYEGTYFNAGTDIRSITSDPTKPGHTYIDFIQTPPPVVEGGKTKVVLILHFKAKAAASNPITITLGEGTSILYDRNYAARSGGEPHDVLQPAHILISDSVSATEPPIPTPKPGNGDPYPSKTPYTYVPSGVTQTPASPTPTFTPIPTPTPPTAVQTFNVTLGPKTNHPNIGGSTSGFKIDGVEGREITLVRGKTYAFNVSAIPTDHPFFLTTSDIGGNNINEILPDLTQNKIVYFTPKSTTPNLIYYQCAAHQRMGWKIHIVNTEPTLTPTSSTTPRKPGDANGDGFINVQDYNNLVTQFNQTGTNLSADFNTSGKVDVQDYNILVSNFGK